MTPIRRTGSSKIYREECSGFKRKKLKWDRISGRNSRTWTGREWRLLTSRSSLSVLYQSSRKRSLSWVTKRPVYFKLWRKWKPGRPWIFNLGFVLIAAKSIPTRRTSTGVVRSIDRPMETTCGGAAERGTWMPLAASCKSTQPKRTTSMMTSVTRGKIDKSSACVAKSSVMWQLSATKTPTSGNNTT